MAIEKPFDIRGLKIPVLALQGMYNDLLGLPLDRNTFVPWAEVVQSMRATGANTVTLIVSAGVMARATDAGFDPTLNLNPGLDAIRALAQLIQANGMSVAISTFANVANTISGDASNALDRPQPGDRLAWQADFSGRVLEWARFSQAIGATAFLPYTDETQHLLADDSLAPGWLALNREIRKVFSGTLSSGFYTSGSGADISAIPAEIIRDLDVLGIGFFPGLTRDANPTSQTLIDAYHRDANGNDLMQFLRGLADTYGKKVWITDKAFHSFDGAATNEARIFDAKIPLTQDLEEQGMLYDSFLQVMTRDGGDWLAGVSFQNFNNIVDTYAGVARFLNGPLSESPQDKPAEAILSAWFNGLRQGAGQSFTDGFRDSVVQGGYHADSLNGGLGNDVLQGYAGNDLLRGGPDQGGPVMGYEVVLELRGVLSQNVSPVVRIYDASGAVVMTSSVTGRLDPGSQVQQGEATRLRFYVTDGSGFSLEETNWDFVDASSSGNRFVRIESLSIGGTAVDLAKAVTYVPGGSYSPVVGGRDTVHGGKVVFDLRASSGAAVAIAVSDHDRLEGGSGDDTLIGGSGNDTLVGGAGNDSAEFSGPLAGYKLSRAGETITVAAKSGADGTDTLSGMERLKFADMTVSLTIKGLAAATAPAVLQGLMELYIAFFNRVPDAEGLAYWIGELGKGQGLNAVADTFYGAGVQYSSLTGFSAGMSNGDFVNVIYRNVLGRPEGADAGGLAHWSGMLAAGKATHGSLVSDILAAAHAYKGDATWGWVANLLDNKVAAARTFAIDWGLGYASADLAISRGMQIAAAVTPTDASAALSLVGIAPADLQIN